MNNERLQEMEDRAKGLFLLDNDELLEWLKKDVILLAEEIRRLTNTNELPRARCSNCGTDLIMVFALIQAAR